MLDSIREVFDILEVSFESVKFGYERDKANYIGLEGIIWAIFGEEKCPVIQCPIRLYESSYSGPSHMEHAMIATGIKETADGEHFVQLKNSFQEDPNEQGTTHK